MTYPLIVSFYTNDWKYPQYAERMQQDCADLGLECFIKQLDSQGGWLQNTCLKPQFILDCLKQFKRPVLWLDIDTKIVAKPDILAGFSQDFAACKMPANNRKDLYVSILAFGYNTRTMRFIKQWIAATGSISDHSSFDETWKATGHDLDVMILPPNYGQILHHNTNPNPGCVFAIELSASESKRQQMAALKKTRGY